MIALDTLARLLSDWRSRADLLRRHGAQQAACTAEVLAAELDRALQAHDDELLTLTEAAAASGYSRDHLGRLLHEGKMPNAGRPGAPRIRRGDVPVKARTLSRDPVFGSMCNAKRRIAQAVVTSHAGGSDD